MFNPVIFFETNTKWYNSQTTLSVATTKLSSYSNSNKISNLMTTYTSWTNIKVIKSRTFPTNPTVRMRTIKIHLIPKELWHMERKLVLAKISLIERVIWHWKPKSKLIFRKKKKYRLKSIGSKDWCIMKLIINTPRNKSPK